MTSRLRRRAVTAGVCAVVAAAAVVVLGADGWVLAGQVVLLGLVVDLSLELRAERRAAADRHRRTTEAWSGNEQHHARAAAAAADMGRKLDALATRLDAAGGTLSDVAETVGEVAAASQQLDQGLRRVDDQCVSLRLEVDRATAAIADRDEPADGGPDGAGHAR